MLQLFHSPRSPFAFKIRILLYELGLADRVALVALDPWTDPDLRRRNPLSKVPTLILEDGRALYDSRVISAYLDHLSPRSAIPSGPERWDALCHEALADGLAEAVIRRFVERLGPANDRSERVALRQEAAIEAALDRLDAIAPARAGAEQTIGDIAAAAALTYLSFRSPEIRWTEGREALTAWYADLKRRPSFTAANFALPPAT